MNITEEVASLHNAAMHYKNALWNDLGMRDCPPHGMVQFHGREMGEDLGLESRITPTDNIGEVVAAAVTELAHGDRVASIAVAIDAYDGPPDLSEDFLDDFKSNPESRVTESLHTFLWKRDVVNQVECAAVKTHYGIEDGGQMAWCQGHTMELESDDPGFDVEDLGRVWDLFEMGDDS